MDFNQNELLAKIAFALFATMGLLISKGHAASLLSLPQEQAVRVALQNELRVQDPHINVTFFRCHANTDSCQVVIKQGNGVKTICDLQGVHVLELKKNAFAVLDSFYFNQIKNCL